MPRHGDTRQFSVWILVWSPTMAIYVIPRSELQERQQIVRLPARCRHLNNWEVFGQVDVD